VNTIEKTSLDFCNGIYDCNTPNDLWPNVLTYLSQHSNKLIFNREAIHTLWTVNGGHLRRKVKNDNLILDILLKYLPKYEGDSLTLYRGECKFLFDDNKIGFCWTPIESVAIQFARGLNSIESGGVLLKAYAPHTAVISSPNKHSSQQMGEHEYTCNPKLLENITVIKTYPRK